MARPSIIPSVRLRLEEYLEQHEAEYLAQPEATRKPTLPYTGDFKVNVRALAEAIGLKLTQEKYLHEREELFSLVNLSAEGQGLLPIGARTQPQIDKSIRERLIMQARGARVDAQAAVEAKAREEALTEALVAQYQELLALSPDTMAIAARRATVDAFNYNAAHRIRDVDLPVVRLGPLASVAVGDPVVCTRNRYRDSLFNGLLGKVTDVDGDLNVSVLWDGETEPRSLDKEAAQDCELAYGITCHRAQGSAARTVLVILENTPLVTREWLYTAITRARERVVIIGDKADLDKAVARRTERTTGFRAAWP